MGDRPAVHGSAERQNAGEASTHRCGSRSVIDCAIGPRSACPRNERCRTSGSASSDPCTTRCRSNVGRRCDEPVIRTTRRPPCADRIFAIGMLTGHRGRGRSPHRQHDRAAGVSRRRSPVPTAGRDAHGAGRRPVPVLTLPVAGHPLGHAAYLSGADIGAPKGGDALDGVLERPMGAFWGRIGEEGARTVGGGGKSTGGFPGEFGRAPMHWSRRPATQRRKSRGPRHSTSTKTYEGRNTWQVRKHPQGGFR